MILFQLLFRGKTSRCEPALGPDASPVIYTDHSDSKFQTKGTYITLLKKINSAVQTANPDGGPYIVTVDGAPAHHHDLMDAVVGGAQTSASLYKVKEHADMYIFVTLPRRSHTLQSGDRLVNVTLRDFTRNQAKLRMLHHLMGVAQGQPDNLDSGEGVMKQMLLKWVTLWLNDPKTPGYIAASWASALQIEPEAWSVDDLPGPPPVIYLGPPMSQVCCFQVICSLHSFAHFFLSSSLTCTTLVPFHRAGP